MKEDSMTRCAKESVATGVALLVSSTVVFGQAARDASDTLQSTGERELGERAAKEIRALVNDMLRESDRLLTEFMADISLSDVSLQFNLGAFQEAEQQGQEKIEAAAGDPIDYDHDGDTDRADLARASQNPLADLISLPFQNNINFNVGALNRAQNVLNIQPVIPFGLNDDWNLITRTIVPVIYQPALFPGDDDNFGIGDIQFTGFLSPKKPVGGWILGAGPVFQFPTATDSSLGARKWTIGLSVVGLRIDGPWVYGALVQNVWSVAGSGASDVNAMLIQPFINYNMDDGWYLTSVPIITADWESDSDNRWLVPVGGGIGKIMRFGNQPVNVSLQAYYNAVTPDFGPDWTLRIQIQLLFPK